MKPTKTSDSQLAEFICSTCQKPISLKARSDVTRFLSFESRCMCGDAPEDSTAAPQLVEVPDESAVLTLVQSAQEALGEGYEVLELLRSGLTGDVFKVREKGLDKLFAVKILHPDLAADINLVKMFQQQAQAAQDLTHVNLAAVYQFQRGGAGSPYIIMDYLDGQTLDEELASHGFLDVPRALDIFIQAAEALAHAHNKGVVHHDLKPSNLVLCHGDSGQELVKLVDFGIARSLPSAPTDGTTTGGTTTAGKRSSGHPTKPVAGSPRHMSPEQCLSRPLDARSDIYSFGCIMYEALTNVPVFTDKNPLRVMVKQVGTKPRPFAELKYEYQVPATLEQVVFRCLEKNPSGRYQSAQALLDDLQRVKAGEPLAPPPPPPPWWQFFNENPLVTGGVALVMLTTLLVVWAFGAFMLRTHFHNLAENEQSITQRAMVALPRPAVKSTKKSATPAKPKVQDKSAFDWNNDGLNGSADHDARVLEDWADTYYADGDYKRAASLLEFIVSSYNDGLVEYDDSDREKTLMAEKCQRLAHCYVELKEPQKAVEHFREAISLSQETADSKNLAKLIYDYSTVLESLGKTKVAHQMVNEYKNKGRLAVIP